jgi:hypothetical protein
VPETISSLANKTMNRIDGLFAILLLIQRKRRVLPSTWRRPLRLASARPTPLPYDWLESVAFSRAPDADHW